MSPNIALSALALTILTAACAAPGLKSGTMLPKDDVANASRPPPQNECRADAYQYLVGKNRSEIPATPAGANWRIVCTSCAVTMDYAPGRLNILFDEPTQVIKEVKCG